MEQVKVAAAVVMRMEGLEGMIAHLDKYEQQGRSLDPEWARTVGGVRDFNKMAKALARFRKEAVKFVGKHGGAGMGGVRQGAVPEGLITRVGEGGNGRG